VVVEKPLPEGCGVRNPFLTLDFVRYVAGKGFPATHEISFFNNNNRRDIRMNQLEQEKQAITATLQNFFEGLDNLKAESILKAFHYKAWSVSMRQNQIIHNGVSTWPKTIELAKKDPDNPFVREKSKKNIVYIDITGSAAQAKVEWVFTDFMYTDYYNLLKVEGRWLIVNRTYHTTNFAK